MLNTLPDKIRQITKGLYPIRDNIGMSGANIYIFDDMVLKVEKTSETSDNEYNVMRWLDGKLPVPKVIHFERADGFNYLLMSKLQGEMACSEANIRSLDTTVKALAEGLKMLWRVDIADCPFKNTLDKKLATGKENLSRKNISSDSIDKELLEENDFQDLNALYQFLSENRPIENVVFSHGDYCLPNIFISGRRCSGFLDLGRAGIADKWQDIALCVRSLHYNYMELSGYSQKEYTYYKSMLFDELGIAPDEEKIKYYILLDELF